MDTFWNKLIIQKSWIAVFLFALSTTFFAGMWYQSTKVTQRDISELKASMLRLESKVDAVILYQSPRAR